MHQCNLKKKAAAEDLSLNGHMISNNVVSPSVTSSVFQNVVQVSLFPKTFIEAISTFETREKIPFHSIPFQLEGHHFMESCNNVAYSAATV